MASDLLGNPLVIDTVRRPMFVRIVLTICLFASSSLAFAQQEFRSAGKGASTPLPITGTSIDADHNGLDVNIVGGSAGGGGSTGNLGKSSKGMIGMQ